MTQARKMRIKAMSPNPQSFFWRCLLQLRVLCWPRRALQKCHRHFRNFIRTHLQHVTAFIGKAVNVEGFVVVFITLTLIKSWKLSGISRRLWSLSHLNYQSNSAQIRQITPISLLLHHRCNYGDKKTHSAQPSAYQGGLPGRQLSGLSLVWNSLLHTRHVGIFFSCTKPTQKSREPSSFPFSYLHLWLNPDWMEKPEEGQVTESHLIYATSSQSVFTEIYIFFSRYSENIWLFSVKYE